MTTPRLRPGREEEARLLSELALRSKGHWGYDQAFLDACRAELTLTPEDVLAHRVTVAERDGRVVGFYALAGTPPMGTLEADPGAEPFYLAMGARRCGSVPSGSIPGRLLPVLEIAVAEVAGC
jgi:hypothetical protein